MNNVSLIIKKIKDVINENSVTIKAEIETNQIFVSINDDNTITQSRGDAIILNIIRTVSFSYKKGKKLIIPVKDIQIAIVKEKKDPDFARRVKQEKITYSDVTRLIRNASNGIIDLTKLI